MWGDALIAPRRWSTAMPCLDRHLDSAVAGPDDARATAPFRPNRTEDSITQCVGELIDHRQVVLPDDVDTKVPDRIDRVPCNHEGQHRGGATPESQCVTGVAKVVDVELKRVIVREPTDVNWRTPLDQVGTNPQPPSHRGRRSAT